MKRTGFTLLLALLAFAVAAQNTGAVPVAAQPDGVQPSADTAFIFRFVPQKEMFFVPYATNQAELNGLFQVLQAHIDHLRAGRMYVSVSSYAVTGNNRTHARRMGYLRNSRVKSELITRAGITEQMFVTAKLIPTPYADSLRNVVVVTFPASVEKIEQIAGAEAAEVVRSYYREVEEQKQAEAHAQRADEEQKQREIAARETAAQRKAEAERQAATEAERERLEAAEQARLVAEAAAAKASPYTLALRTNLLRWATLTPDVGVQWRINRDWAVAVNGAWSSWSWDNSNRRYALWEVSPEAHYYIGKAKQWYVGAMLHFGQFNYKLSDTGKQGDLQGGGIVGGYALPIGKRLMLDFNLGIGCTHADYDTYTVTDGVKVRTGNHSKNYWGVNKAGVTLVWKLF